VTAAGAALALLVAALVGLGSALLPVVNAEAYAVVAAGSAPALGVAFALAVGPTAGKLVLFESARRGTDRWKAQEETSRRARWTARVRPWLTSPRTGPPVVLLSATLGLPPLAVVALVAGACGQPRRLFAALVLLGRGVRFAVIVLPAAQLLS
jgi:membrane protein YqaA with SNARE-associated domain